MTRLPVLLLLLALGTPQVLAQSTIPATVLKVVDGDTFDAELHPLPDTTRRVRVRVMELDTPELRGHNSLADAAAHAGDHDPSRHGCAAYSQGPARAAGGSARDWKRRSRAALRLRRLTSGMSPRPRIASAARSLG